MDAGDERLLQMVDRPMVITELNDEDRLVLTGFNDEFIEMSGFNRDELMDERFAKLEAADGSFPKDKIITAITNNLGGRYVYQAHRPGDIAYEQCLTVVPGADPDGNYRRALVYVSDYTDWKLWRPAREHHRTGFRDEYFFRLYLSRMVRRSNKLDQTFGLVEINVYEDGLDEDVEQWQIREVYEPLVDHIESVAHEDDVLAHHDETTLVVVRPDVETVDQSLDDLGRLIGFELKREHPNRTVLRSVEADVTWSTYPSANTPFRMLGYELSNEVA